MKERALLLDILAGKIYYYSGVCTRYTFSDLDKKCKEAKNINRFLPYGNKEV